MTDGTSHAAAGAAGTAAARSGIGAPLEPATARGVSRRTLVTGAAWAVPVVSAAVAAPMAAASALPLFPEVFSAGAIGAIDPANVTVAGNKAASLQLPAAAFAVSSVGASAEALAPFTGVCGISVTGATLTMGNGVSYAGSAPGDTVSHVLGVASPLSDSAGSVSFANVAFSSGTYIFGSNPSRPASLVVDTLITLNLKTPVGGVSTVSAARSFAYPLTAFWSLGVVTPTFLGGNGAITYPNLPEPE